MAPAVLISLHPVALAADKAALQSRARKQQAIGFLPA